MAVFRFKQFTIQQERSAMKVGTDSILLGAWTAVDDEVESILDIGAGTGILALMLAQRSDATHIDAVEIDSDAHIEAVTNFENSLWADRLFCYHSSIQEFSGEMDEKYDLIISNPPYFNPSKIQSTDSRSVARQTHLLNHITLLQSIKKLLKPTGTSAFIIPVELEDFFLTLAGNMGLYPYRIMRVKDMESANYKRTLLQFKFIKGQISVETLTLKNDDTSYSDEFVTLTKDFYLNL
jgi:tRNA1Val (adenine37-N6)-methyltransferase